MRQGCNKIRRSESKKLATSPLHNIVTLHSKKNLHSNNVDEYEYSRKHLSKRAFCDLPWPLRSRLLS